MKETKEKQPINQYQFLYNGVSQHFVEIMYSFAEIKREVYFTLLNKQSPNRSTLRILELILFETALSILRIC